MNEIIIEDLDFIISSGVNWNRFKNKTILITGAGGMLLLYMILAMLRINELKPDFNLKVIALVRNKNKIKNILKDYAKSKKLKIYQHDLSSPIKLRDSVDFIVHGASYASPKYFRSDPVSVIIPNIIGTYYLLEFAKKQAITSFLYISSGAVYGSTPIEFVGENNYGFLDPLNIINCYGESKRMAENMCSSWCHQFGVPVKMVRPAHIYGPTMNLETDNRVFASFIKSIIKKESVVIKSDGSAKRSFCYVADATVALLKVMLDGASGEAYNVGNDNEYMSIKKLVKTMIAALPEKHIKFKILGKTGIGATKVKEEKMLMLSKKVENLGWKCAFSLRDGLKRTVKSYANL